MKLNSKQYSKLYTALTLFHAKDQFTRREYGSEREKFLWSLPFFYMNTWLLQECK